MQDIVTVWVTTVADKDGINDGQNGYPTLAHGSPQSLSDRNLLVLTIHDRILREIPSGKQFIRRAFVLFSRCCCCCFVVVVVVVCCKVSWSLYADQLLYLVACYSVCRGDLLCALMSLDVLSLNLLQTKCNWCHETATTLLVSAFLTSTLDYCTFCMFAALPATEINLLQRKQTCASRLPLRNSKTEHVSPLLQRLIILNGCRFLQE